MKVAVLAVQGAFAEHEKVLEDLGIPYVELRKEEDTLQEYDALILPGGESTVQGNSSANWDYMKRSKNRSIQVCLFWLPAPV